MRASKDLATSGESGFTLIELLIGTAMALLVSAAAVTFLISIMHRAPKTTSSADVIGNARVAVEQITADLRVGEKASTPEPSRLTMKAECSQVGSSAAGSCEVAYNCFQESGLLTYECQRTVANGRPTTVISGLNSGRVFCVYPTSEVGSECGLQGPESPLYVGVRIELPNYEESQGATILEGGAALHNAPGLLENG